MFLYEFTIENLEQQSKTYMIDVGDVEKWRRKQTICVLAYLPTRNIYLEICWSFCET